jgi:RNA polymerase sigma-70 factor (ECF subfamily)
MIEQYILISAKNGDSEGFRKIYEYYNKRVYCSVKMFLKHDKYSEDITQEIFIKVFSSIQQLKSLVTFESWLHKIIFSTCIRFLLKNKKEEFTNYDDNEIYQIDNNDFALPENELLKKELNSKIMKTIYGLEDHYRLSIILYYYYDISIKEISKIMNCKEGTVKSRLFNGKSILKKKLFKERID